MDLREISYGKKRKDSWNKLKIVLHRGVCNGVAPTGSAT
jgi:hypothetical protein